MHLYMHGVIRRLSACQLLRQDACQVAHQHAKNKLNQDWVKAGCELVMQGVCIHKAECPLQSQPCHSHADHHQEAQNSPRAGGGALATRQNRQAFHGGPGWQRAPEEIPLHRCAEQSNMVKSQKQSMHCMIPMCHMAHCEQSNMAEASQAINALHDVYKQLVVAAAQTSTDSLSALLNHLLTCMHMWVHACICSCTRSVFVHLSIDCLCAWSSNESCMREALQPTDTLAVAVQPASIKCNRTRNHMPELGQFPKH